MTTPSPVSNAQQDIINVTTDQATTVRFLTLLFEGLRAGFVEFRFFNLEKRSKQASAPTYLSLPLEEQLLETEVLSRNGQHLIAFSPAQRFQLPAGGRAGRDHDVLAAGCVWAHLEHRGTKGGAVEVLRRVRDFPLRPSAVVNLGYAHQVYFVFHEPLRDDGLLAWGDLMLGLSFALAAGIPPALSQTATLPGTISIPAPQPVSCMVSQEYSSWTRYGVAEIETALRTAAGKLRSSDGSVGTNSSPPFTVEQLRRRGLSTALLEAILTGRGLPPRAAGTHTVSGESGADFRLAYALFAHACTEQEIKAIFRAHPHGCGRKWAQKRDGEKYLSSLLAKVTATYEELKQYGRGGLTTHHVGLLDDTKLPPGYVEHEDGSVWFHPPVSDDARRAPAPLQISNAPLHITGIRESVDTGQISITLSFDYLGRAVSAPVPRAHLSNPRQLANTLAGLGAPVSALNARLVTAYLVTYEHHFAAGIPRRKITSRFGRGRADGPFILPGVSADVEFIPAGTGAAALYRAYAARNGSLRGWLEVMRVIAQEALMIPQAAVLAALIPPLQRRLQIPNFILDLHGDTSTGKSTSLRLAASVYGKPADPESLVLQWTNTSAAVEQVAAMCSELPVFLDDAQHCPASLKRSLVYMIANGRGKGRGGRGGSIGETPTWHTVALSTSEEPLHEASPHEGARGRLLPVGGSVPTFRPGTAALVREVEQATAANHGHAGEVYVRHLNNWTADEWRRWLARYGEIRGGLLRGSSSDLAGRVSGYVAAIQLAAEVAGPLLGLPFEADVVGPWLMLHLNEQHGTQNYITLALRALADYYVAYVQHFAGDGHYDPAGRGSLYGTARRYEYVGFLRSAVDAAFRTRRWNQTAMLNKLAGAGALYSAENDRHTRKVSISGVKHRMVCVKWVALFPDDAFPS